MLWRGLCLLSLLFAVAGLRAESPQATAAGAQPARFNLQWTTLGGQQFWSDELVYGGWRMQRHAHTGHYRLLDAANVRRAWGTEAQCREAFDRAKRDGQVPALSGKAVVTLHGYGRGRDHMEGLGAYLEERENYHWINVSYASTRRSLDDHAASLARVIASLEGIDQIDFVCHSMGNLVVRRYLGEAQQPEPGWQVDARIGRMVMLGPPNNGAQLATAIADLLHDNGLAQLVAGPSALQLARRWDEAVALLATPSFPFGVIAGGCGDGRGLNPLVHGDDDLIVSVDETKLPGASDFRMVHCRHGHLMNDPSVREAVACFLKHGYFSAEAERRPIPLVGNPLTGSPPLRGGEPATESRGTNGGSQATMP